MKRYPLFRVYEPSKEEIELEKNQSPILEKLSDMGFGIKIADDMFMDMPCMIHKNNYPLELYRCVDNVLTHVQTFYSWDEIREFSKSIN